MLDNTEESVRPDANENVKVKRCKECVQVKRVDGVGDEEEEHVKAKVIKKDPMSSYRLKQSSKST